MTRDSTDAPFDLFVQRFNAGNYHGCIAPLEELWFQQRDDFHKGLIRVCVGLNQIGLGLDSGPHFLLTTARELLAPYGAWHNGIDLRVLAGHIDAALALLNEPKPRAVPPFQLVVGEPRAR